MIASQASQGTKAGKLQWPHLDYGVAALSYLDNDLAMQYAIAKVRSSFYYTTDRPIFQAPVFIHVREFQKLAWFKMGQNQLDKFIEPVSQKTSQNAMKSANAVLKQSREAQNEPELTTMTA